MSNFPGGILCAEGEMGEALDVDLTERPYDWALTHIGTTVILSPLRGFCSLRTTIMTPDELRSRRLAAGVSREKLATEVGVQPNQLAKWENGDAPIEFPRALELVLRSHEGTSRDGQWRIN
jgi:DNA-binding XRE family transcriptional regulator